MADQETIPAQQPPMVWSPYLQMLVPQGQQASVGNPQELINEANVLSEPSVAPQRQALASQLDLAQAHAAQTPALDLAPLVALAENYTGRKLSYKSPGMSEEERAQLADKLQSQIAKTSSGISEAEQKTLSELIKAKLAGAQFGAKTAEKGKDSAKKDTKDSLDARLALSKTKQANVLEGAIAFNQNVDKFEDALNKNPDPYDRALGPARAEIDSTYANLKTSFKEAANLGALSGPDVKILDQAINNPAGVQGFIDMMRSGGNEGLNRALNNLRATSRDTFATNIDYLEGIGADNAAPLVEKYKKNFAKTRAGGHVGGPKASENKKPAPPPVGTIENGYIHKGDNYWEPVNGG